MYDLGGGTFDISILEIQKGVFEVRHFTFLKIIINVHCRQIVRFFNCIEKNVFHCMHGP